MLGWLRGIVGQRIKDQDAEVTRLRGLVEQGAASDRKRAERAEKRLEEALEALVRAKDENGRLRQELALLLPRPADLAFLPKPKGEEE